MKKIPLQNEKIIPGDILWDVLTFSKKLIYGNYYQILGNDIIHGVEIVHFNIYDKDVNFIEKSTTQTVLFEMGKDRFYKIEFDNIQERAKFLLLMNTSS